MSATLAIASIRRQLSAYTFKAVDEYDLQAQVLVALKGGGTSIKPEVIAGRNRYDFLVRCIYEDGAVVVVLELKVKGSVASVERQAQRYALTKGVDAVVVVTTSQRLANGLLVGDGTLGGKPFGVIALRTF